MKWVVRLYPRWWRERYGEEVSAVLDDLRTGPARSRAALGFDLLRGALDAHVRPGRQSPQPPRVASDGRAVRRGVLVAFLVWAVVSVEIVRSNVWPQSAADDDGPYVAAAYAMIFASLVAIGAVAHGAALTVRGPILAGAVAGAVLGVLIIATFLVVDNVFFTTISRQQTKIDGWAASGLPSMRTYVNLNLAYAMGMLAIALAIAGAALAPVGAAVRRTMARNAMQ